ncbi:MAG: phosphoribulokinase [Clostridia bacterium]|nr:phosphoribulokinase [Clostridia bacterium]
MVKYTELCEEIEAMICDLKRVIIAIDGMCAAGKTTLANKLKETFKGAFVVSMDDFYLPLAQRSDAIMAEPGGHMDYERFDREVATPLWKAQPASYGVFDCHSQSITETVQIPADAPLIIVEGTYATHPAIPDIYDYRIFVKTDSETQKERVILRDGKWADDYFQKWIPFERAYFSAYMTEALADAVYSCEND